MSELYAEMQALPKGDTMAQPKIYVTDDTGKKLTPKAAAALIPGCDQNKVRHYIASKGAKTLANIIEIMENLSKNRAFYLPNEIVKEELGLVEEWEDFAQEVWKERTRIVKMVIAVMLLVLAFSGGVASEHAFPGIVYDFLFAR